MTRLEALNMIENDLQQMEIKSTKENIQRVSRMGNLLDALIELEIKEIEATKKAEAENEKLEGEADVQD